MPQSASGDESKDGSGSAMDACEIEYVRSGARSSVSGVVGGTVSRQVGFGTDSVLELPWDQ